MNPHPSRIGDSNAGALPPWANSTLPVGKEKQATFVGNKNHAVGAEVGLVKSADDNVGLERLQPSVVEPNVASTVSYRARTRMDRHRVSVLLRPEDPSLVLGHLRCDVALYDRPVQHAGDQHCAEVRCDAVLLQQPDQVLKGPTRQQAHDKVTRLMCQESQRREQREGWLHHTYFAETTGDTASIARQVRATFSRAGGGLLKHINLSTMQIGDDNAGLVANLMACSPGMESVNLTKNNIGDSGARRIAGAMLTSRYLFKMDLRGNKITSRASSDFVKVLKEHPNSRFDEFDGMPVRKLLHDKCHDLQMTDFTDFDMNVLGQLLESSSMIQTLEVGSSLTDDSCQAFVDLIKNCKSLNTLYLDGNNVSLAELSPST
jgi:hypothetical protein